jgi:hypothetical protein
MYLPAQGLRLAPVQPVPGDVPGELVEFRDGATPIPGYSFPTIAVGSVQYKTLSVFNRSAQAVTFAAPAMETLPPFSVANTTCSGILLPGQACEVTIRYAPQTAGYFTPDLTAWGRAGTSSTLLRALVLYGRAT